MHASKSRPTLDKVPSGVVVVPAFVLPRTRLEVFVVSLALKGTAVPGHALLLAVLALAFADAGFKRAVVFLSAELELHGNVELRGAMLDFQRAGFEPRMVAARFHRKTTLAAPCSGCAFDDDASQ